MSSLTVFLVFRGLFLSFSFSFSRHTNYKFGRKLFKSSKFKSIFFLEQQVSSSKLPSFYRGNFFYFQKKVTCLTAPFVVRKLHVKIGEKQICSETLQVCSLDMLSPCWEKKQTNSNQHKYFLHKDYQVVMKGTDALHFPLLDVPGLLRFFL